MKEPKEKAIIRERHLSMEDIKKLYPLVNRPQDWKINTKSHQLMDKIVELWFESQGYDFWINPYPEVIEIAKNKDNTLDFKYEISNNDKLDLKIHAKIKEL